jgi:hypothetical protein
LPLLTYLLKKEGFVWSPKATAAFDALKRALSTASVLQLPDFNKPFLVDCDASVSGFRAVLHQGDDTLVFFSHPFTARHHKLTTYEHELIRLVLAMCHWWPYL